ncbi:MAG: NAD(P)/FAD-dependent oxidoreductase, partial [Paracoccaceae bacterium]
MGDLRSNNPTSCDVAIIGGGIIGCAVAFFLSLQTGSRQRIIVIEKDPRYRHASTALSAASIRTQFSNRVNVEMSLFGGKFLREFSALFTPQQGPHDLGFRENGYLFLAETPDQISRLRTNHAVQNDAGVDVVILEESNLNARFPYLKIATGTIGSLGLSGEGWFDNMGLLGGLKQLAKANGVLFLNDRVSGFRMDRNRIEALDLASGQVIRSGDFVNAAGPRAAQLAAMAGLHLPIEPRKRTTFVFQTPKPPPPDTPLIVDPAGVYVRPEGRYWMAAVQPDPDPPVAYSDLEPRFEEFDSLVWPRLASRAHLFEAAKCRRMWAGHYAYNTLDQNAIIG